MQTPLTLATLADLDNGLAGAVIDAALRAAINDTDDRGDDGKIRKVAISVEFEKIAEGTVATVVVAKPNLPPYRTKGTIGRLRVNLDKGGGSKLLFEPMAPENPDQQTLDYSSTEK